MMFDWSIKVELSVRESEREGKGALTDFVREKKKEK